MFRRTRTTGDIAAAGGQMSYLLACLAAAFIPAPVPFRFTPKPVVARTVADIMASRGVTPVLSPNLDVLATVEALGVKRLLFIGVGCQVGAARLRW